MDRKSIGKTLQDKRKASGLSVYRIAKDYNITRPQVDSIEKGTANWTADTLLEYCKAIGINNIIFTK